MIANIIVVDDFYSNVDGVRSFALEQNFLTVGNYPGCRTKNYLTEGCKFTIQKIINPYSGNITNWFDGEESYTGSFQLTTENDKSWIHVDCYNDWGGVLYLTPNAPINSGTGFYKSKLDNSLISNSQDYLKYNGRNFDEWELVTEVGNVYNRLILFRANQWHSSMKYFGSNLDNGRLTQVFFFDTEK